MWYPAKEGRCLRLSGGCRRVPEMKGNVNRLNERPNLPDESIFPVNGSGHEFYELSHMRDILLVSFLFYLSICYSASLLCLQSHLHPALSACVCECLRFFQLFAVHNLESRNDGGIWIFHIFGHYFDCHLLRCLYYALHHEVGIIISLDHFANFLEI